MERATGLAPRRLVCESLLLKLLCASVHTLCWCGGWEALSPICTLINLQEKNIKSWENRQYLHVKLPRTSASLAKATPWASVVLQILGCTRGHDNDILCPITPAANSTGHDGEEHTINPVSIIDTNSIPQIRTLLR